MAGAGIQSSERFAKANGIGADGRGRRKTVARRRSTAQKCVETESQRRRGNAAHGTLRHPPQCGEGLSAAFRNPYGRGKAGNKQASFFRRGNSPRRRTRHLSRMNEMRGKRHTVHAAGRCVGIRAAVDRARVYRAYSSDLAACTACGRPRGACGNGAKIAPHAVPAQRRERAHGGESPPNGGNSPTAGKACPTAKNSLNGGVSPLNGENLVQ